MRTMYLVAATALAAVLAAGVPGAASGSVVVDRVVAVVNNEIITMSDLQRELAKGSAIRDEKLLLEEMIDRKLQMAAARQDGMVMSDRELDEAIAEIMKRNSMDRTQLEQALAREGLTMEQYRNDLREQITLSRLFNKYIRSGIAINEDEVRAFYDRNPGQFSLPEEVRIRLLVVPVPAAASPEQVEAARSKADELLARLRSGADFITLIRESSSGPTRGLDGDLGFLQRGQAIPEIEAAAKDLKAGDYAGPVRVADTFQIIKVEEVRRPVRAYEKVKDEISKMLYEQRMENTYRTWLQTLRGESHIENRL